MLFRTRRRMSVQGRKKCEASRSKKPSEKEAAGAADAGLMQIEWSETEGLKLAGVVKAATVAGGGSVQRRVDGRSEPRRGQEEDVRV